jgi:hypothetical protein
MGFGIIDKLPQLDGAEEVLKTKFAKDLKRLEGLGVKWVIKRGVLAYWM